MTIVNMVFYTDIQYTDFAWFGDSAVCANSQTARLSNSQCKRDSFKAAYRTPPY